jgi:hypothetical protein
MKFRRSRSVRAAADVNGSKQRVGEEGPGHWLGLITALADHTGNNKMAPRCGCCCLPSEYYIPVQGSGRAPRGILLRLWKRPELH